MKNRKFKFYFCESVGKKPNLTYRRHFIHNKESCGFWAERRDLSRSEILANNAAGIKTALLITIGYNPAVLEMFHDLIIEDEYGKTYKIKNKPDEYNYSKGDIKIEAYEYKDNTVYGEDDIYENNATATVGN